MPNQFGWYWREKEGKVYFGNSPIRKAELSSFLALNENWALDSNNVYAMGSAMKDADPESFVVLNDIYAKDRNRAYTITGPIPDADVATFRAIGPTAHSFNTTNGYAVDKNRVYHTTMVGKALVLPKADPNTFAVLKHGFAKDTESVFHERGKLQGANPNDWQYLGGPYSICGKYAYCKNKRITGTSGSRYAVLPTTREGYWFRDSKSYFYSDIKSDSIVYFEQFKKLFIFIGEAVDAELRRPGSGYSNRDLDQAISWNTADHAWIKLMPEEWIQDHELELQERPLIGTPFRFGEGLHLKQLYPTDWMHRSRVWICAVSDSTAKKLPTIHPTYTWWLYNFIDQISLIRELVETSRTL